MCNKDDMSLHTPCQICGINPASEIQGGHNYITGQHGLWFCCKSCKQHLVDERKNERRKQ